MAQLYQAHLYLTHLNRTNNATIEVIIEERGFNNSLEGSANCPNSYTKSPGNSARKIWIHKYLKDGTPCNSERSWNTLTMLNRQL